ncbi:MAG: hypothetical protein M0R66_02705 [Candidatus Omnitrophica bacterium]|jgi:hypothetical protein|nr:hypothetical protein [Sphaerochaeta sp.]MCK9603251.1 hypothetical protein [Candidatus Omnitrophota bacterium]
MSNQLLTLLNTETGEISTRVPAKWFGTIISDKVYTVVKDGTKPYAKRTYKPRAPRTFIKEHPEKVVSSNPLNPEETE